MCQEASKYIMTISEVSEKYGLTADTLRYYERIGLLPRVARKANGVRDYRQEDCQMIGFIKCLRGAGMPVDLLIQYFGLVKQGDATTRDTDPNLVLRFLKNLGRNIRAALCVRRRNHPPADSVAGRRDEHGFSGGIHGDWPGYQDYQPGSTQNRTGTKTFPPVSGLYNGIFDADRVAYQSNGIRMIQKTCGKPFNSHFLQVFMISEGELPGRQLIGGSLLNFTHSLAQLSGDLGPVILNRIRSLVILPVNAGKKHIAVDIQGIRIVGSCCCQSFVLLC